MNKKVKNVKVNENTFENLKQYFSKENVICGLVLAGSLAISATFLGHEMHKIDEGIKASQAVTDKMLVETSYDAIENLNLVLDNSGLDDRKYHEVVSKLKQDGISFRQHQGGLPVTADETVLSLTSNPYVNGDVALYGPLYHSNNNADNLMMSFKSACENESFEMENIHFGREVNGTMEKTSLEAEIGDVAPMLTLQFADAPISSYQIASLIENGITRYAEQVEMAPYQQYFHSLQAGETLDGIKNDYQLTDQQFSKLNSMDTTGLFRIGTVIQIRGEDTYALDTYRTPTIADEEQKTM